MIVDGRRDEDVAKAIATLALTSKATYPSDLLRQLIEYCMIQLEHRMSEEELLAYANTLREPYLEDAE